MQKQGLLQESHLMYQHISFKQTIANTGIIRFIKILSLKIFTNFVAEL